MRLPRVARYRDVDFAIAVFDDAHAERLTLAMQQRGYRVVAAVEQQGVGRLATVRLAREGQEREVVDLLFASSGIEPEIVSAADPLEVLAGLTTGVASIRHLFAMKLLSRDDDQRPADAADLAALRDAATTSDWRVASDAVALISARGFDRGRGLADALAALRGRGDNSVPW